MLSTLTALLLVLCMTCSASAEITAEPSTMPLVDEPIHLTGYCLQSPQGGIGNEMIAWKMLEKMTGICIDWTDVPTDSQAEMLNVMLASGQLPDIIYACGFSNNDLVKYGSQGLFADLTEAYEKYAYNLQAVVEKYPDPKSGLVMADGRIYGMPQLKLSDNMLTNIIFVNPDWLQVVGLDMPTNFAEFEAMLYAFRDNDCNGNGDPSDEIPSIIRYNDYHFLPSLYTFFGLGNRGTAHRYVDGDEEQNSLRFIPTSDRFRDLLTVAHRWYADGLIDVETFQNTSSKQIVAKTSAGLVGVHSDFVTNIGSVYQDIFRCLPVLENYDGEKIYTRRSQIIASPGAFVVSAECPDVDELVKWANSFYSEEGLLMYNMGIEGVTFEFDENGQPQWKDEMIHDPNSLTLTQKRVQSMGFQGGCGAWTDETYQGAETYWTATELMDDYRQYLPESIAGFISGTISLDTWDQYVATLEGTGLEEYMNIHNAMHQRYSAN